jgi:YVTN family beta-propeller protein
MRRAPAAAVLLIAIAGCGATAKSHRALPSARRAPPANAQQAVLATIRTGAAMGLVAGEGGIWLSNHREGSVSRIDPRTNRVVATVRVGDQPSDLAVGFGSVWVPVNQGHRLVRLDPRLARIVASVPGTYWSVAAGHDSVWALEWEGQRGEWTDWHGRTLTRIDPRTNRVRARVHLGPELGTVAAGAGALWVSAFHRPLLYRLDPRTAGVDARIRLPRPAEHIAVGDGAVWVGQPDGVVRVDARRNRVTARVHTGHAAQYVAAGEGGVWVANVNDLADSTLSRVDPRTNRVTRTMPVGFGPQGVAAAFGSVWVGSFEESDVWRIRPQALAR